MIAADRPQQRPADARLLVIDCDGRLAHRARSALAQLPRPGDIVIANDAATLPASLHGEHLRSGQPVEVRLAGRGSLEADDLRRFTAIVFGAGDHRTRTEERPAPPPLQSGDRLRFGAGADALHAEIVAGLGHPRLVALRLLGDADAVRDGLARLGRPVQYAHVAEPLALWDVWTPIAGPPVAFEPPSAGFALDWALLRAWRERGARFATLTHAAGLSSTGDVALDARLPFDEPYRIPAATARALARTRQAGGRVIAIGTTVVRALEHAAAAHAGRVPAGEGVATQTIDVQTRLRVVDVLLSGTHEPGTSHHRLLQAFIDAPTLRRTDVALEAGGYRTHEFGDSVWIERRHLALPLRSAPMAAGLGA